MTPEEILRKRREKHAPDPNPPDAVTVENPISAVVRRPAHCNARAVAEMCRLLIVCR